jgi:hypothetical protein
LVEATRVHESNSPRTSAGSSCSVRCSVARTFDRNRNPVVVCDRDAQRVHGIQEQAKDCLHLFCAKGLLLEQERADEVRLRGGLVREAPCLRDVVVVLAKEAALSRDVSQVIAREQSRCPCVFRDQLESNELPDAG